MKCPGCGAEMKTVKGGYKYVESGLDNVYLQNVTIHKCSCGELMPEIPNIHGVHETIAGELVRKPTPLSGPEIRFLRKAMRLSAKALAAALSVTAITIPRWETEAEKPKLSMDKLIRLTYNQFRQEHCKQVVSISDKLAAIKEKNGNKPMRFDVTRDFQTCCA